MTASSRRAGGTNNRGPQMDAHCFEITPDCIWKGMGIALHPKTGAATSPYTEFAPRRGQSVCYVFVRAFSSGQQFGAQDNSCPYRYRPSLGQLHRLAAVSIDRPCSSN